jgi:hypothetical protein
MTMRATWVGRIRGLGVVPPGLVLALLVMRPEVALSQACPDLTPTCGDTLVFDRTSMVPKNPQVPPVLCVFTVPDGCPTMAVKAWGGGGRRAALPPSQGTNTGAGGGGGAIAANFVVEGGQRFGVHILDWWGPSSPMDAFGGFGAHLYECQTADCQDPEQRTLRLVAGAGGGGGRGMPGQEFVGHGGPGGSWETGLHGGDGRAGRRDGFVMEGGDSAVGSVPGLQGMPTPTTQSVVPGSPGVAFPAIQNPALGGYHRGGRFQLRDR